MIDPGRSIELAEQLADGELTLESRDWLAHGFRAWLDADADLELARCLALPPSPAKLRLARRDYWLTRAAELLGPRVTPWARANRLYLAALRLQNGLRVAEPPEVAAALQRALAAEAPMPSTPHGLQRVLRKNSDSRNPEELVPAHHELIAWRVRP